MAVVVGAMSAPVAYALLWLINIITNLVFFQRFSSVPVPLDRQSSWRLGDICTGRWWTDYRTHGTIRLGENPRPWNSGSPGSHSLRAKPNVAEGRGAQATVVGDLDWHGGPFGAEGPIIMTGGAFGSLFAQFFNLSLVGTENPSGCRRGGRHVGRLCRAHRGGAFGGRASFVRLAAAELHSSHHFRNRSQRLARAAAWVRAEFFPCHPMPHWAHMNYASSFGRPDRRAGRGLLTILVYAFEDLFTKLPIHWMWWPAIGGLFVGIGGWINPSALGVGYETIHSPVAR